MQNYIYSRAAGGYHIHARNPGSFAALCGFEPGKNARQRCMVDRSGWRICRNGATVTCRKCLTAIEMAEANRRAREAGK